MKTTSYVMRSLLLLLMAQTVVSCIYTKGSWDDGPRVVKSRPLKNFDKISIVGSPSVHYFQADTYQVTVEGSEEVLKKIVTDVEDGTLIIRNKGKIGIFNVSLGDLGDVSVHVGSPDLTSVSLSGSGDFVCSGPLDTDEMHISLRGSGDVSFDKIICDNCTTELVGSGDVRIKRLEAFTSDVTLIGSGDMEVWHWNVDESNISLRGSGDITVHFEEGCKKVDCQLTGSGDITLDGQVEQMNKQKAGSGDIDTDRLQVRQ